jgi:hypothetical protein
MAAAAAWISCCIALPMCLQASCDSPFSAIQPVERRSWSEWMDTDEIKQHLLTTQHPIVLYDTPASQMGILREGSRWTVKRLLSGKLLDPKMPLGVKVHSGTSGNDSSGGGGSGGDFVYYDNDRASWWSSQGLSPPTKGFKELPMMPSEIKSRFREKRWNPQGSCPGSSPHTHTDRNTARCGDYFVRVEPPVSFHLCVRLPYMVIITSIPSPSSSSSRNPPFLPECATRWC